MRVLFGTALLAIPLACTAGELILQKAIERDRPFLLTYRTGSQATGKGTLNVNWTDADGRQVGSFALPVELTDENEIQFSLDGRHAVAMQNYIQVHFSFSGKNKKEEADNRDEEASASFC